MMKKLMASFLFVLIGLYAMDRLGGMAMWWVNQHTHDVAGPKIRYLANDVHEDVLLMGTSRCNLHYVPSVIAPILGMSVYNGGIDASNNIYSHYIILNLILAHHTPKVICLELMSADFAMRENPFKTVTFFAPYFGKNKKADSVFREAGLYRRYQISHLYRYNAKAASNIEGLFVNRHAGGDNGYIPVPKPARFPDILKQREMVSEIDMNKLEYVQKFIDLCREKQVKLVFMVSPSYSLVTPSYYDVLEDLAMKNHVPFLDYHTPGLFADHPEYFKDASHLWNQGAMLYSAIFAEDLKKVLSEFDW